jgi:hypothetical protein
VAVLGPPQPAALAVTIEVPLNAAAYVTSPVAALIELPPEMLAAFKV